MKPDQLYQELKDLAEKLQVSVSEQNLRATGIKARSGLCKIKGKNMYIIDKNKSIHKKNELLGECLSNMSHEEVYVVPAVRDFLVKYEKR